MASLQAAVVKGKQYIIVDSLTARCVRYEEVFQENLAVLFSFRAVSLSKSDCVCVFICLAISGWFFTFKVNECSEFDTVIFFTHFF